VKLKTLKSRLQAVSTTGLQVLQPATVERKRGSAGVRDRKRIRQRDCDLCQECKRHGQLSVGEQVDHITPLSAGGSDEDSNKELLCRPCHDAKSLREAGGRSRGEL
jgi:5-methylcytosine-specific restriction protein A